MRMRSLRTQLLISHLLLVLVMGLVMSASITSMFMLSGTLENMYESNLTSIVESGKMRDALASKVAATYNLQVDMRAATRAYGAASLAFDNSYARAQRAADTEEDNRLVGQLGQISDSMDLEFRQVLNAKDQTSAQSWFRKMQESAATAKSVAIQLSDANLNATKKEKTTAIDRANAAATRNVIFTFVALAIAILLAGRMMKIALTPLALLAKQAEVIGSGELHNTLQLGRNDEIGELADSFNEMANKLADLRRMEARRLRRMEKMTDSALESLYDPVIVADAKGRIVHLNKAAEELFGPAPESPRLPVIEHIGDQRIVNAIRRSIEQQTASATEDESAIVPLKVEGGSRTYRLRATPMKEDDGGLLGSVVVLEDITHLRQLDRLKTDFIGVASHELRTPITSLLLSNELMAEGAAGQLTPEQRQLVEAQREDLQRLERLTRELLDLSRLEAGSAKPRIEMVSSKELVEGAVRALRPLAEEKGVQLEAEAGPELPDIPADRSQITQVLVNLLNNAIRHTPAGGKVTARATVNQNQVTFDVADTGEGIPPEYLAKIFDRFVQVPGATGGGAGLGLSIAQRIVKAHGGVMQVGSELGKGSTFSFSIGTEPKSDGEEAI